MFLAIKEMKYYKGRYILIVSVVALIFYLAFFLTSLAFGLAKANRSALDHIDADGIVISVAANNSVIASSIDKSSTEEFISSNDELLNVAMTNVYADLQGDPRLLSIVFIGSEDRSEIIPSLVEGMNIANNDEVVASVSLKEEGLKLNDIIQDSKTDRTYKIVGFTKESKYNTLPVVYTRLDMVSPVMQAYKNADSMTGATINMPDRVNAVVISKYTKQELPSDLIYLSLDETINNLPGYQAQVLTFGLMISFLSVISAIIIGIFMYILTIQKIVSFGILKAQGFNDRYIVKSVTLQTLILVCSGLMIGYVSCMLSLLLLPASVPIAISYKYYGIISILTILFALLGTIFSIKAVTKIDPLDAIKGA